MSIWGTDRLNKLLITEQSLFPREQNLTTKTFQFSYQDPSSVMGGASLMSGNSLRWICQFSWCKKFYHDHSFQIVWCSELGIHMNRMFFPNLVARLSGHKKMAWAKCSGKKVFSRSPSLSSTPTWPTTQINLGTFLHRYLGTYPDPDLPMRPPNLHLLVTSSS